MYKTKRLIGIVRLLFGICVIQNAQSIICEYNLLDEDGIITRTERMAVMYANHYRELLHDFRGNLRLGLKQDSLIITYFLSELKVESIIIRIFTSSMYYARGSIMSYDFMMDIKGQWIVDNFFNHFAIKCNELPFRFQGLQISRNVLLIYMLPGGRQVHSEYYKEAWSEIGRKSTLLSVAYLKANAKNDKIILSHAEFKEVDYVEHPTLNLYFKYPQHFINYIRPYAIIK